MFKKGGGAALLRLRRRLRRRQTLAAARGARKGTNGDGGSTNGVTAISMFSSMRPH